MGVDPSSVPIGEIVLEIGEPRDQLRALRAVPPAPDEDGPSIGGGSVARDPAVIQGQLRSRVVGSSPLKVDASPSYDAKLSLTTTWLNV